MREKKEGGKRRYVWKCIFDFAIVNNVFAVVVFVGVGITC